MIAMLATAFFVNSEGDARDVSIQALIKLPAMDARDTHAAEVLARTWLEDIDGFSRPSMLSITDGNTVQVSAERDHLRISMTVPRANLEPGLALLEAVLRRPRFSDVRVRQALERPRRPLSAWAIALDPVDRTSESMRGQFVMEFHQRIMRPENVFVAVGGNVAPSAAQAMWERKMGEWRAPRLSDRNPYLPPVTALTRNTGGVTTVEFAGPVVPSEAPGTGRRLLALVALGVGKDASLFRIARERLRISYRQESVLSPTPAGWQSRLLVAMRPRPDTEAVVKSLRDALIKDAEAWTEADLQRAQGLADETLDRLPSLSPLGILRSGPVSDDLAGRTFLTAYWPMKTGQPWRPDQLRAEFRAVRLADLRADAIQLLRDSTVRILPAG